jgi:hypothetical protein
MRAPGFFNTKDQNNFKLVTEEILCDTKYNFQDVVMKLPELTIENERTLKMHVANIQGISQLEDLDVDPEQIPEKFVNLLQKSAKVRSLFSAEKGSRSEADFAICHILYDNDFSKKEALGVLMNTNKALSKGPHRKSYAAGVVQSVYSSKSEFLVPNAAEKKKLGNVKPLGQPVKGPRYFDCLENPWRSKEMLGLIGGTGVGKTSITLDIFYNMIKNNTKNDDIFIFFSLELGDEEILAHWDTLTKGDEELTSRLYVVDNQDAQGNHRGINLQQIYWFTKDIAKSTGKKVAAIAIDHVGIISKTIDTTKSPDFGLKDVESLGFGKLKTLGDREITKNLKALARQLDCFMIVQSQTTKEKAGEGDVPLGTNAAYGVAQFEWDMDYVMTIWQPLKRVEFKTDLRVTAFQYCKIRKKGKKDKISVMEPRVLSFDVDTKVLKEMTPDEFEDFKNLNKEASILRKQNEKKEFTEYSNPTILTKVKSFTAGSHLREIKQV